MPVATFDFYKVQVSGTSTKSVGCLPLTCCLAVSSVSKYLDVLQEFRVLPDMPKSQEVRINFNQALGACSLPSRLRVY